MFSRRTPLTRWYISVTVICAVALLIVMTYRALYSYIDTHDYIIPGIDAPNCSTRECHVHGSAVVVLLLPFAIVGALIFIAGVIYVFIIDLYDTIESGRSFTSSGLFLLLVTVAIAASGIGAWIGISVMMAPKGTTITERFESGRTRGAVTMIGIAVLIVMLALAYVTYNEAYEETMKAQRVANAKKE